MEPIDLSNFLSLPDSAPSRKDIARLVENFQYVRVCVCARGPVYERNPMCAAFAELCASVTPYVSVCACFIAQFSFFVVAF